VKEDHDGGKGGKDCFSRRKRQVENKEKGMLCKKREI
jgi:hypothetical protein